MPQKNKKARQAQAQRAPGSKFFSKDYIDNFEDPDDTDYINEEDSGSDSDGEGWIVSLLEHDITDLGAIPDFEDDRERHGPIVNDNLDHSDGGKK
jgi:hypothetical protein